MPDNLNDNGTSLPTDEQHGQYAQPVQSKQLDKSQKIAVAVLAFFAVLVMVVWLIQTKQSLSNPNNRNSIPTNQASTCSGGSCGTPNEADLRLKDTDGDGLNDYDELNLHNTSPYLEDSDSDGYSDGQEVQSQNDPNCPFGQQCYVEPVLPNDNLEKSTADFLSNSKANNIDPDNIENLIKTSENILDGGGDADSLRAMLIQAGMDTEALNSISDEYLMDAYKDILPN